MTKLKTKLGPLSEGDTHQKINPWPRVLLSSWLYSLKSLKVQKKAFYQPWLVDIWTFPKGFPQKLGPNNALFRIGMQLLCHMCFYKRTFLTENQTVSKMTWQTWHHFTLYFSKFFICGTFSQVFISLLVLGQFSTALNFSRSLTFLFCFAVKRTIHTYKPQVGEEINWKDVKPITIAKEKIFR